MDKAKPDLAHGNHRSLERSSHRKDNFSVFTDGSDQQTGNLLSFMGGVGAERLLKPNFQHRARGNFFRKSMKSEQRELDYEEPFQCSTEIAATH
jgi:hypothetical protein